MADTLDIPAWIILFLGLYALAAGVGELRAPGGWAAMLDEFEQQAGLRFVTGLVALALGAAIYLANPWRPGDWLAIAVSVIGAVIVVEGALLLASGDRFIRLSRKAIGTASKSWAGLAALLGAAMIIIALSRL